MVDATTRNTQETVKNSASVDTQTGTVGNRSDLRSVYANTARISISREEIILLFGMNSTKSTDRTEDNNQFTDRIILNPYTAKRLSTNLNNLIQDYESLYGPVKMEPAVSTRSGSPSSPNPTTSETGGASKKADFLFQLIKDLNVQTGIERSFKISRKNILLNRFLLGFRKNTLKGNSHNRILDICRQIEMPENLLKAFTRALPDAKYIHFGFEENNKSCIYKTYLEFYDKIEQKMKNQQSASDHFLMHLGFKWDVSDRSRQAITEYIWHPSLSVENSLKKLSHILHPDHHKRPLEITKGIFDIALRRIPYHDILTLDVTEKGNPRNSFDINIYQAKFQLSELFPFLLDMFRHYSIPPEQFYSLYEQIKTRTFGHLSGGIDREGNDFLTVYYGVEDLNENNARPNPSMPNVPLTAMAERTDRSRKKRPFAGVEITDEKAGKLLQIINNLNIQVGFERSFKALQNSLLTDRFLAGFNRDRINQKPDEKIMNICRQIDMPEDFQETFQDNLSDSNIILFGFEGSEKNRIYKAYLEFGQKITEEIKQNPNSSESFLIHMGFKWDVSDNSHKSRAEYTCFPMLTVQDMLKRLSSEIYSPGQKSPLRIAEGIINLAASRVRPYEFLYFEASETGNPRKSFDINMYRANLTIKELYPLLMEIVRYYAIPDDQFYKLYKAVSSLIFGHLTGGTDREGRDFLTVYFGEKGSTR